MNRFAPRCRPAPRAARSASRAATRWIGIRVPSARPAQSPQSPTEALLCQRDEAVIVQCSHRIGLLRRHGEHQTAATCRERQQGDRAVVRETLVRTIGRGRAPASRCRRTGSAGNRALWRMMPMLLAHEGRGTVCANQQAAYRSRPDRPPY